MLIAFFLKKKYIKKRVSMMYAVSNGSNQPAHLSSVIRFFAVYTHHVWYLKNIQAQNKDKWMKCMG